MSGALAVLALVLAGLLLWQRRRTQKLLQQLEDMIAQAQNGTWQPQVYDESRLSALESHLGDYLSASALAAHNQHAEKDKLKELIADIAHQVKTPLANLVLYSQLLQEQALPQEAAACAEVLRSQSQKLQFLLDCLVKISRLEAGVITLHPAPAPVQPLLNALEQAFADRARQKNITLTLHPTRAEAVYDSKWTGEALGNILDNALKYTPAGGQIEVQTTPYQLFCRLDIRDTGCGISPEEQAKVFARFYRSPDQHQKEGVGIGLYLAREILSQQGGYIKLSSAPGTGSTFSVFLPL